MKYKVYIKKVKEVTPYGFLDCQDAGHRAKQSQKH